MVILNTWNNFQLSVWQAFQKAIYSAPNPFPGPTPYDTFLSRRGCMGCEISICASDRKIKNDIYTPCGENQPSIRKAPLGKKKLYLWDAPLESLLSNPNRPTINILEINEGASNPLEGAQHAVFFSIEKKMKPKGWDA